MVSCVIYTSGKVLCIIVTNHGGHMEQMALMFHFFFLSGTILNASGLWEVKDVYCHPRAVTKILL